MAKVAKGRKRRAGVKRYDNGRIINDQRGETELQVMATAMAQRIKLGASNDDWRAQEWESPLGRLLQAGKVDPLGGVSARQYEAIKQYATVRHRYMVAMGFPPERPKCIAGAIVAGFGGGSDYELEDDEVYKRRRPYTDAKSHLISYAQRGVEWVSVCEKLSRDESLMPSEIGQAREAANILAHLWKIG